MVPKAMVPKAMVPKAMVCRFMVCMRRTARSRFDTALLLDCSASVLHCALVGWESSDLVDFPAGSKIRHDILFDVVVAGRFECFGVPVKTSS